MYNWFLTPSQPRRSHQGDFTTTSQPIYCQVGGRKSASLVQLSPDALTDVPDWVTTPAVQDTFWDSDSFNVKCYGRQLAPSRCNLGGGSVWDVVVQPSPERTRTERLCVDGNNGAAPTASGSPLRHRKTPVFSPCKAVDKK